MLLTLIVVSFISYFFYGPYFSPDSVNYFHYATHFYKIHPWTGIYSPFYPFVLSVLLLLPNLSLFLVAHLLILVQYVLGVVFLYQLAKNIAQIQVLNLLSRYTLTLIFLIPYHTWWSFRIVGWAHADSTFYFLLIIWFYLLSLHFLRRSPRSLLLFSLVGALLVWTKNNGLMLVPFLLLLIIWDKSKIKWWIPLASVTASYLAYQFLFPQNILLTNLAHLSSPPFFSLASLELLGNNLGELFKSSLGFLVSDVAASFMPQTMAMLGGIILITFLTYVAVAEVRKGLTFSSYFYLFGLVYLICLLLFQQATFYEEINFRTLFPFIVPCSWFLWIRWISIANKKWIPQLMIGLVMTLHTVIGHMILWNRENVNSLFEVDRMQKSGLIERVKGIRKQAPSPEILLFSDQPEKLGILLNDPYVGAWNADYNFIQGKRRAIPETDKLNSLNLHMDNLMQGQAVAVLFSKKGSFLGSARKKGLLILNYPEGLILIHPSIYPL